MSREPVKPISRGASQSRTRGSDLVHSWWLHHKVSAYESLQRLLRTPVQTLMTALVVAIALALPATLLIALNNVQQLGENWDASPKISVFLRLDARPEAIEQLQQQLEARADVRQVQYISPEQALADFQEVSGFGEALKMLDENPLPPTLIVAPAAHAVDPAQLQLLLEQIAQHDIVDQVDLDMEWVRRLHEIMILGRKIIYALAGLLGLGALLAVGNTIRLAIENRREEILVIKLVGGTNSFARRPFLYSGGWYGLIGGLLAAIIVGIGYLNINGPVARLAAAYQSDFVLRGLGWSGSLYLLCLSTGLGLVGAWLAVSRHLGDIEPK